MKSALFMVASIGWIALMVLAMVPKLGMYYDAQDYMIAACLAFALVLFGSGVRRRIAIVAFIVATAASLYCYHYNAAVHSRLLRLYHEAQSASAPTATGSEK